MTDPSSPSPDVLRRFQEGDREALAEIFMAYRERLRRMVGLRIDRRLAGRIDPSDVVQEAFLDISRRFDEYRTGSELPIYVWLRFLTGQKLQELHRRHLGAQMRDAGREISLYRGSLPQASSACLAARLLGELTSPTEAAVRAEIQLRVQDALDQMDAMDREILALRHFEELSNGEAAEVLQISKAAASNRYIRALRRLKKVLKPDLGIGM